MKDLPIETPDADTVTKITELMIPIERQILQCVNDDELLVFACAMLQRTHDILNQVLGEQGRKAMFKELT